MYILTERYKHYGNPNNSPEVAVLDTTDGTLEIVNYFEALRLGLDIVNVCRSDSRIIPNSKNLYLSLMSCYKVNDFVTIHEGDITVGGRRIDIWSEKYDGHKVNGVDLPVADDNEVYLASLFMFREYVILRFIVEYDFLYEPDWISVAVNERGGVKYWSADYSVASHSASLESEAGFGMKVDIIHGA